MGRFSADSLARRRAPGVALLTRVVRYDGIDAAASGIERMFFSGDESFPSCQIPLNQMHLYVWDLANL